mmetsp:Transcript_42889/g.135298  ORF Transcript_42889/g.135298 Transcript_42889/m.135298 type:complete len:239 (-) Transcript_42889:7161-7877(-)
MDGEIEAEVEVLARKAEDAAMLRHLLGEEGEGYVDRLQRRDMQVGRPRADEREASSLLLLLLAPQRHIDHQVSLQRVLERNHVAAHLSHRCAHLHRCKHLRRPSRPRHRKLPLASLRMREGDPTPLLLAESRGRVGDEEGGGGEGWDQVRALLLPVEVGDGEVDGVGVVDEEHDVIRQRVLDRDLGVDGPSEAAGEGRDVHDLGLASHQLDLVPELSHLVVDERQASLSPPGDQRRVD